MEQYTYDFAGNISSTTDANGGTIQYRYNSLGKVSERIDQEGRSERFYYDKEGRNTQTIDRNGGQVRYRYTMDGEILGIQGYTKEGEKTTDQSFAYDVMGRLVKASWESGCYQYAYTPDGKLESKHREGKLLFQYGYDANGNRSREERGNGDSIEYLYNTAGQLMAVQGAEGRKIAGYQYDKAGRIIQKTQGNGITTTYQYNGEDNLTYLHTTGADGKELLSYRYQYDGNGNRIQKTGTHNVSYQYDPMGRLTQALSDGRKERYTYDHAGNRLSKETEAGACQYTYNRKNQLVQQTAPEGIFTYQYDFQGNLTREERPDGKREYHYNALQQQTEVLLSEKSIWKNGYDAEGLRETAETEESSYHFVYNPEKDLIAEREEGKEKGIQYLYGNQEAVVSKHLGKEPQSFYYAQDEQGSTALLADKEGEIKNRYFYSAFGELLEQEEQVENRLTYTGQQWDNETEQYYLRARYYNPAVGRFVQEDAYRGDGLNLYAYCANNPVMYCDPSGYAKSKKYKDKVFNGDEPKKKMGVKDSGHHVPAVRKSKNRQFEVKRSDKSRPTLFPRGSDAAHNHWRLHDAERSHIGPRQGDFNGTADELFDAYRKAYKDLDDIKVDIKSPNGDYTLGTDVTPQEAVDLIQKWLKDNGLY